MAEEKQSFVLYKSWNGAVELMSDESAGRLFKAIMCYAAKGTTPQIGADIVPLFGMMRSQFEIDNDKYTAKCAKLSDNGKKGAEAKRQKQAIANNCKQTEANTSLYDMSCNDMRCNDMSCNKFNISNADIPPAAEVAPTQKTKKFTKPTLDEIKAFCREENICIDAEHFFNYYESNGWKVGKNSMKNWKSAVKTWVHNGYSTGKNAETAVQRQDAETRLAKLKARAI